MTEVVLRVWVCTMLCHCRPYLGTFLIWSLTMALPHLVEWNGQPACHTVANASHPSNGCFRSKPRLGTNRRQKRKATTPEDWHCSSQQCAQGMCPLHRITCLRLWTRLLVSRRMQKSNVRAPVCACTSECACASMRARAHAKGLDGGCYGASTTKAEVSQRGVRRGVRPRSTAVLSE
jgi:hypothetical protein